MDRRMFIGVFAGSALHVARVAYGQPAAKVYRIGFLTAGSAEQVASLFRAFDEGLRDLGYIEGRNIAFERRYADGRMERLPDLAADLVRLRVDVMVSGSNPITAAAKRATTTIPIVMIGVLDPVGVAFVASLARPGGNITGVASDANAEIYAKYLGLLAEIVPGLSRVGVLRQADFGNFGVAQLEAAARKLNVALDVAEIRSVDQLEGAFATMTGKRVGAVIVVGSLFYLRRQQLADLALKHRLPAIHAVKEYAQAGLLLTYGPNLQEMYRQAASHVARILRGARPADLPVELPTKFELVINRKTAKALGITIPKDLLLRADEVIQ